MARSLARAGAQPDGSFAQSASGTRFESRKTALGTVQSFKRRDQSGQLRVDYAIGSGEHAVGFLALIGDHLFQSPMSYYTARRLWDVAPGYEQAQHPDFSRPVTTECLSCHSDRPRPIVHTLNRYASPPFDGMAIGCDRCHGTASAHLQRPVPGSIINPAKLPQAARDSVCEQCHLAGEVRIPNPGRSITDFEPGKRTEEIFTTYVTAGPNEREVKVISHSEQLARSTCARVSAGRLWCGTCHNPHETPAEPAAYYRERCLSCHAAKLSASHAAPGQDCAGCHMPKRPAKDGGHTAFTDHRITRRPEPEGHLEMAAVLTAWREPPPEVRERNQALALVTAGMLNGASDAVIRGYRTLNRIEPALANDAFALTELGSVLLTAKQPLEAERRFRRALVLRPTFAPYEVNLGNALLDAGDFSGAISHGEKALELDPLLLQAVQLADKAYRAQGQIDKAKKLVKDYQHAMGLTASETP